MPAPRPRGTFKTPSPAAVIQSARPPQTASGSGAAEIPFDPFAANPHAEAMAERGLMLAPLMTSWHYRVLDGKAFRKWLRTKDIILSPQRFALDPATAGIRYFGTYVTVEVSPDDQTDARGGPAHCRTLWGYLDQAALDHMHDLGRGRIERVSIVQNDLTDFLRGLKRHIADGGPEHFRQEVMVSAAV